jgi:hypothetical protein
MYQTTKQCHTPDHNIKTRGKIPYDKINYVKTCKLYKKFREEFMMLPAIHSGQQNL